MISLLEVITLRPSGAAGIRTCEVQIQKPTWPPCLAIYVGELVYIVGEGDKIENSPHNVLTNTVYKCQLKRKWPLFFCIFTLIAAVEEGSQHHDIKRIAAVEDGSQHHDIRRYATT